MSVAPRSFGWMADKRLKSFWQHDRQLLDLDYNIMDRIEAACAALGRPLPRCGPPKDRWHVGGMDQAMARIRELRTHTNRQAPERPAGADHNACLGHRPDNAPTSASALFERWFNANGARSHGIDPETMTAKEAWAYMQSRPTSPRAPRWCTSYWDALSQHATSGALSAVVPRRTPDGSSVSTIDLFRRATGTSTESRGQRLYAEIMSGLERSGTWQFAKKWAESGAPQRVVDLDRVGPFLRDVCTLLGDTVERDRADAYRHGPECARLFGAAVVTAAPSILDRDAAVESSVCDASTTGRSNEPAPVAAKQSSTIESRRDSAPPLPDSNGHLAVGLAKDVPRQDRPCGALSPSAEPPLQTKEHDARRFCFLLSEDDPLDETDTDDDQEDCEADNHDIDLDDQPSAAAHFHKQTGTAVEEQKAGNSSPLSEHDRSDAPRVSDWSADEVGDWVATCDGGYLAGYRETFVENCITGRDLQDIASRGLVDCLEILQQMGIDRTGDALDLWRLIGDLVATCSCSFPPKPATQSPEAPLPSSSTLRSVAGSTKRRSEAPTKPDAKKPRTAGDEHLPRGSATRETSNAAKDAPSKCARCSASPVPGHTLCEPHRLAQNARQREYDRKRARSKQQRVGQRNKRQRKAWAVQKHRGIDGTADAHGTSHTAQTHSTVYAKQPHGDAQRQPEPHHTPKGVDEAPGIAHYFTTRSAPLAVASRYSGDGYGHRQAVSVQGVSDDQQMHTDPPTSTIGITPLDQATPILTPSDAHVVDCATTKARDEIESVGQGAPTKRKRVDQETIDDEGTETEDEELPNKQGAPPSPIEVDYPPMTPRDLLALWPERRRTFAQHTATDGGDNGNDDDIKEDDNAECDWYVQRNVQA
ncbi:SAM domain containing protein [Pandoravirus salinus]|uniref:SAM domain containing protein n=1 Tax=Pandoravirus salinus TaxID=1349410 RepID=S4VYP2_9VIRU|nr:SAM domain [Pandoravirus salinus]AGO85824.1 SAM domain containing protein [Pandoravirus salinus]